MQIKRIHIQGFKSLEDVIFEPETGFSCLVGSNGAGKSNFCDALLFFKSIILNGVENTLNNFMSSEVILNKDKNVSLKILILGNDQLITEYFLGVDTENVCINKELLKISETFIYEKVGERSKKLDFIKLKNSLKEFRSTFDGLKVMIDQINVDKIPEDQAKIITDKLNFLNGHASFLVREGVPESLIDNQSDQKLSNDKTALSSYFDTEEIFHFFSQLNIYRINPLVPKTPNKVFNKSNLQMYGENLAMILAELKKDPEKWQTLHDWLSLIVPSISEVQVKQGEFDESLSLHFNEGGKLLPAISISDGTIYTLSILAAVLWNQDKNTLIVIEEPERGIHPQALSELINFMREATEQNLNIITTTHSETFVRNCKLEELWLVDKIAGSTKIKSAKKQNPHLKEVSLDQAWLMNLFNGGLPW